MKNMNKNQWNKPIFHWFFHYQWKIGNRGDEISPISVMISAPSRRPWFLHQLVQPFFLHAFDPITCCHLLHCGTNAMQSSFCCDDKRFDWKSHKITITSVFTENPTNQRLHLIIHIYIMALNPKNFESTSFLVIRQYWNSCTFFLIIPLCINCISGCEITNLPWNLSTQALHQPWMPRFLSGPILLESEKRIFFQLGILTCICSFTFIWRYVSCDARLLRLHIFVGRLAI